MFCWLLYFFERSRNGSRIFPLPFHDASVHHQGDVLAEDVVGEAVQWNDVSAGTLDRRERLIDDRGFDAARRKFIFDRIKGRPSSQDPDSFNLVDLGTPRQLIRIRRFVLSFGAASVPSAASVVVVEGFVEEGRGEGARACNVVVVVGVGCTEGSFSDWVTGIQFVRWACNDDRNSVVTAGRFSGRFPVRRMMQLLLVDVQGREDRDGGVGEGGRSIGLDDGRFRGPLPSRRPDGNQVGSEIVVTDFLRAGMRPDDGVAVVVEPRSRLFWQVGCWRACCCCWVGRKGVRRIRGIGCEMWIRRVSWFLAPAENVVIHLVFIITGRGGRIGQRDHRRSHWPDHRPQSPNRAALPRGRTSGRTGRRGFIVGRRLSRNARVRSFHRTLRPFSRHLLSGLESIDLFQVVVFLFAAFLTVVVVPCRKHRRQITRFLLTWIGPRRRSRLWRTRFSRSNQINFFQVAARLHISVRFRNFSVSVVRIFPRRRRWRRWCRRRRFFVLVSGNWSGRRSESVLEAVRFEGRTSGCWSHLLFASFHLRNKYNLNVVQFFNDCWGVFIGFMSFGLRVNLKSSSKSKY